MKTLLACVAIAVCAATAPGQARLGNFTLSADYATILVENGRAMLWIVEVADPFSYQDAVWGELAPDIYGSPRVELRFQGFWYYDTRACALGMTAYANVYDLSYVVGSQLVMTYPLVWVRGGQRLRNSTNYEWWPLWYSYCDPANPQCGSRCFPGSPEHHDGPAMFATLIELALY